MNVNTENAWCFVRQGIGLPVFPASAHSPSPAIIMAREPLNGKKRRANRGRDKSSGQVSYRSNKPTITPAGPSTAAARILPCDALRISSGPERRMYFSSANRFSSGSRRSTW